MVFGLGVVLNASFILNGLITNNSTHFLTTGDLAVKNIKPSKGIYMYLLTRNMQALLFFSPIVTAFLLFLYQGTDVIFFIKY